MKTYGFYKNKMLFMDYSILYDRPFIDTDSPMVNLIADGIVLISDEENYGMKHNQAQEAIYELILRN